MTSPSKPSLSNSHILSLLPLYASQTTSTIQHITKLLSRTSTLDTTLLTTTYTLHLLHALLTRSPYTSRLRLTTSLAPLTALLDEFRIFLRLWGLLGIYTWAAGTWLRPPKDRVVWGITWVQICVGTVFQVLENGAFLAGRGVLGWEGRRVERAWSWSSRMWCAHVGCELVRLGYEGWEMERKRRGVEEGGGGVEGKEGVDGEVEVREEKGGDSGKEVERVRVEDQVAEERWRKWRRELVVNAAYAPMTMHYSLENGPLGEGSLGLLGVIVGWLTIGKAWRESA